MTDTTTGSIKPPYLSFATFWTYIKDLGTRPLPPALDRSMMTNKSGTDQANLLATMKAFGLISEQNAVLPALTALVEADEARRKELLAEIVQSFYEVPMQVSSVNGTENDLQKTFKDTYGLEGSDTRRKAVTFFLHAAKEAGLPLSPNFKQTRQTAPRTPRANGTQKPRTPRGGGSGGSAGGGSSQPKITTEGDTYTVTLMSGGAVSVVVDVNLFQLSTEDREFVIGLVDKLKGYEQPAPPPAHGFAQPTPPTEEDLR